MSSLAKGRKARREKAVAELAERMSEVCGMLASSEDPEWKRTTRAMQAMKGQNLTDLPALLAKHLQARMLEINTITSRYAIERWDDYQIVSVPELKGVQRILKSIEIPPSTDSRG